MQRFGGRGPKLQSANTTVEAKQTVIGEAGPTRVASETTVAELVAKTTLFGPVINH